jgi:hypothetical protein
VVPASRRSTSPKVALAPGQTSYDVDQSGLEASCPSGDVVLGTGFDDGAVTQPGFVLSYGTFVGESAGRGRRVGR